MARLNVNPTRMVLTGLKKRLRVARRGHKLLKDKRDELMKRFLEIVRENKVVRENVEEKLSNAHKNFLMAKALMQDEILQEALMFPKHSLSLEAETKNIMSVNVPVLKYDATALSSGDIYPYGLANTSAELDSAIATYSKLVPDLLQLAQLEKSAQLLADEIEKTRRRVNALEYRTIPDLEETIRFIRMKLDESERSTITRLMKVKELINKEAQ